MLIAVVLCLIVVFSAYSYDVQSLIKLSINNNLEKSNYCQYDSIILNWSNFCVDCKLAISSSSSNIISIFDICSDLSIPESNENEFIHHQYITCEESPNTCVPTVDKITILNNQLHLEFLESTNGILLNSTEDILDVLHFEPALYYNYCLSDDKACNDWFYSYKWNATANHMNGSWNSSNKVLIISGESMDGSFPYLIQLLQAHNMHRKIAFTPYLPPSHTSYISNSASRY